ncbi:MAG: trypsin-like peptidase domain-containing protein [Candidatus Aminicenantes bacterium]|nr:trypsin-like peptidase domain-containing protein [Candidatus Aminicenantes bacterium]
MRKLCAYIVFFMLLPGLWGEENQESSDVNSMEPPVLSVVSGPLKARSAAYGTGIIVDKDNGLILTARHGVYKGDLLNYKNEKLFKKIKLVDKNNNRMEGYIVHLSLNHDLALIKVERRFTSQATFIPSNFLKIRDEVEFEGFANGEYGVYWGRIANTKKEYLNLDMTVGEGMSGGPIIVLNQSVVGVVLLKQKIGGTALRSEIIIKYLSTALPQARKVRKKNISLCLKKVELNDPNRTFILKNKDAKFYFQLYVNGKEIFKSTKGIVTGSQIQWDNSVDNKFKTTLLPGDKIKLEIYEAGAVAFARRKNSWPGKTIHIKKSYEELPQKGLPDLYLKIVIENNAIFFESFE